MLSTKANAMALKKTRVEVPAEALRTLEELGKEHGGIISLSPIRNGSFQVLLRTEAGKRPAYLGTLRPGGRFKEKHVTATPQKALALSQDALKTYERLCILHGKIILSSKSEGRFRVAVREAEGMRIRHLGILHPNGTFKERHRTSTEEKVLGLPQQIRTAYECLSAQRGRIILTPTKDGGFTVRTPRDASSAARHIGMFNSEGRFKEGHNLASVEKSQGLSEAMLLTYKRLAEAYGNLTILGPCDSSVYLQKYDPAERKMKSIGTIMPDGTFKPSRALLEGLLTIHRKA